MKKNNLLIIVLILLSVNSYGQYDHQNINFLGLFTDSSVVAEPVYGIRFQSCIGWVDQANGNEYGIIGSTAGTYIVDVSNPVNPVQIDYVPHRQNNCIWHEYVTYQDYLYVISDDNGNNSLQIIDMSTLPDSVNVVYDSDSLFVNSHTIFIDGDKLYCASVSTAIDYSSMNVYSLANPVQPLLLRRLDQDYAFISQVHDMFVVNDTVYASCGYDGLFIFHFDTDSNKFHLLGSLQDPFGVYNHSSFLSPDHRTLYLCEEVPDGQPVKIIDVTDISDPTLVDTFYSNIGATPHNPRVEDEILYIAYYQDGVYAYDISSPLTPVRLGFFDTYPTNTPGTYLQPAYAGCWSVYSELPSGILLASDMQSGLFCLDVSNINGVKTPVTDKMNVYPNPSTSYIKITDCMNSQIEITDILGKVCLSMKSINAEQVINVSQFSPGLYILNIVGDSKHLSRKIVIE